MGEAGGKSNSYILKRGLKGAGNQASSPLNDQYSSDSLVCDDSQLLPDDILTMRKDTDDTNHATTPSKNKKSAVYESE